jgi:hypothetical protein
MAVDPSIALQTQVPNPTNLISGFLDLGLKRNQLERSNETLLSDIARSKAESRTAQAGANVAEGTEQPLIQQQKAVTSSAQTAADSARFHLTGEQAQLGRQIAGGLIQDPDIVSGKEPEKIIEKLADARQSMIDSGVPKSLAEANTSALIQLAKTNPSAVRSQLATIVQQGLPAGAQAAQNLIPAAAQQQVGGVTPSGNPTVIQRDQFGTVQQAPLQAAPAPQQSGPLQYPPGENPDTYKQLNVERDAGRQTVNQAPTIHKLNGEILDELNKATTGQYSGIIARGQSLAGMLGLSLTGNNDAERAASAYDLIDKYTTQAATRAAQSMGNDTATALNAQMKQNASVERNPTAIKKSIKLNDAILTGAEIYQKGLEQSIANNPQQDIFIKRKFDQAWAQNFDPTVMQIYNAKKNGDTAELNDLLKSLGSHAPEIAKKAQNLQNLMKGI